LAGIRRCLGALQDQGPLHLQLGLLPSLNDTAARILHQPWTDSLLTGGNGDSMKPIIGITADYTLDSRVGLITSLGLHEQDWIMLARDYTTAVEKAGGVPLLIPVVENVDTLERVLDLVDALLFTGGNDVDPYWYGENPRPGLGALNPDRDRCEMWLMRNALSRDLPVLGICRGLQVLNVAAGGTLYQDLKTERPAGINHTVLEAPKWHTAHRVTIEEGTTLFSVYNTRYLRVNSLNHQAVKSLGEGLRVAASADDGLTEAVEASNGRFVVGVQWHPEMMIEKEPTAALLFLRLIEEARRRGGGWRT